MVIKKEEVSHKQYVAAAREHTANLHQESVQKVHVRQKHTNWIYRVNSKLCEPLGHVIRIKESASKYEN